MKIQKAKAQLELKLSCDVSDNNQEKKKKGMLTEEVQGKYWTITG